MKKLLISLILLFPLAGACQKDSTQIRKANIVSVEMGGGSYGIYSFGNPFNIGYHRIIHLPKRERLQLGVRMGVGTAKASISPPPEIIRKVFIPIETCLLLGKKSFKGEIGIGFTAIFGRNEFTAETPSGGVYRVHTKTYQFVTGRIGCCFMPMQIVPLFIRVAWTPAYVLPPNPIPINNYRFNPYWASLTLGFTF